MRALRPIALCSIALCTIGPLAACVSESEPIPPVPLAIATASLTDAMVGQPYTAQLTARGGRAPYVWSIASPPAWLVLAASTGALSGTPEAAMLPVELAVRLTDATGTSVSRTLTLAVRGSALRITTRTLPEGKELDAYSATLEAEGGTPPLAWTIASGALPRSLFLGRTGAIAGSLEAAGSTTFTARVTDAASTTAEIELTLVVRPLVPMIAPTTLPRARFDEPYEFQLRAVDVRPPADWRVTSGQLPRGLGLDLNGLIAGRPTEDGTFTFVVQLSDGGGRRDEVGLTLDVVSPIVLRTRALPTVVVGRPYSTQLEAAGGIGPYRYSATGALPAGIQLAPEGRLFGTAQTTGRWPITITVDDAIGSASRSGAYTLAVSDRYEYAFAGDTSFPPVCTATTVAVADVPIEVPDSFAIRTLESVEVEYTYMDMVPGDPLRKLRLWLISPSGQSIALCGDRFTNCPLPIPGVGAAWPPLMPLTPLSVVVDTNPRGTWRLRAGVDGPTVGSSGACQQTGHILRVRLVFEDDRSTEPYAFVEGWFSNNLIQQPWLRIWGANHIGESELSLSLSRWSPGPNQIREAGAGDDVLEPDTITWSLVSAPPGTTITTDGHLVGGQVTGRGTVRAEDSRGAITDLEFLVVPPDWNTQRTN